MLDSIPIDSGINPDWFRNQSGLIPESIWIDSGINYNNSFNLISTNQLRPAPGSLKKWKVGKVQFTFFNSIIGWPGRLKRLGPNGAISVVLSHNINYSNAPNTYDLAVLGYDLGLISAPFRDLILLPISCQKRIPLRACFCVKPKGNKGFEHCREDRKGAVSGPEMVPISMSIPDSELDHFGIPFCGFTDSWDVWILRVSLLEVN